MDEQREAEIAALARKLEGSLFLRNCLVDDGLLALWDCEDLVLAGREPNDPGRYRALRRAVEEWMEATRGISRVLRGLERDGVPIRGTGALESDLRDARKALACDASLFPARLRRLSPEEDAPLPRHPGRRGTGRRPGTDHGRTALRRKRGLPPRA
jgi:hypothetical protein